MDVYDAIPTIVTTFVALIAKISIFILLLQIVYYTNNNFSEMSWTFIILLSSLFSLIIGTVVGVMWGRNPLLCLKLPNSGNTLELLIPNYIRKFISGWTNHSCTVISQKTSEKKVGYRGSKSVVWVASNLHRDIAKLLIAVKEQRVYGSCIGGCELLKNYPLLRYTLTGFERNYQVRILSNRIYINPLMQIFRFNSDPRKGYGFAAQKAFFSTSNLLSSSNSELVPEKFKKQDKLHPDFITGFADGEGFFGVSISKNNKLKSGWQIQLRFVIGVHMKDAFVLEQVKDYFGVGITFKDRSDYIKYSVQSMVDLQIIIDHFEKHPLKTQKYVDYVLFKQVFNMIKNSEHLTDEGITKIVSIKSSLNWGLSENLVSAFPAIVPYEKAGITPNISSIFPYWLAGFTSGEGSFIVTIFKSKTVIGYAVRLTFQLTQHTRDEQLLLNVVNYLGCGKLYRDKEAYILKITKLSEIHDKIIPFFIKYPILGVKSEDFHDWCLIADLMKQGKHLTEQGLKQIRSIKSRMNKGRD